MNGIIEIGVIQLFAAYIFLIILLAITRRQGIGKEKEILISSLRMTIQLIIMGYVLVYMFTVNHYLLSIGALVFMEYFAIRNIYSRIKVKINRRLRKVISLSMISGTTLTILFFLLVVIGLSPWYETRYFIPIAGMIIGNSMTGISLGAERLIDGIKNRKDLVEGALMLGATPERATKSIVNDAFTAAILPTINSMVGMGIVFLPGMMTGQILSGVSPLTAIEYQIAIMLGIMGSVSLTVFVMVQLGYKTFFNERSQLEYGEL
ncbi:ABC transporter permease [Candidatus Contubernalis alkaliaceticus]|uniref:ABC transporter permease n=1 Tax=Candidatus Contubernalis alkaliaceticus TaxID=338645 RepID=UPI001F4C47A3|nr:iron export ABC transporter permease subunit FetB [Candidatus Contubernalis alkalaceticus]UNC92262.1 iron export ABC transporter permease subunit FetB [Candidatus Contubernalis alkalaceticus]